MRKYEDRIIMVFQDAITEFLDKMEQLKVSYLNIEELLNSSTTAVIYNLDELNSGYIKDFQSTISDSGSKYQTLSIELEGSGCAVVEVDKYCYEILNINGVLKMIDAVLACEDEQILKFSQIIN